MSQGSRIEWTQVTWNPVTGCTKVSQGCKHCYALRMAKRLNAMGSPRYRNGFRVTLHEDLIELPLRWRKPRLIFVNSMSDLFHPDVPLSFIRSVFQTMQRASHHTFQVLTKRSARLREVSSLLQWPDNVWIGVSVESDEVVSRVEDLQQVPAAVRFLSVEPLLGPIPSLPLKGIDWVIVGGESGPGARPMKAEWAVGIRDLCEASAVPFFFKQWGGITRKRGHNDALLDGRIWHEMPRKVAARTT